MDLRFRVLPQQPASLTMDQAPPAEAENNPSVEIDDGSTVLSGAEEFVPDESSTPRASTPHPLDVDGLVVQCSFHGLTRLADEVAGITPSLAGDTADSGKVEEGKYFVTLYSAHNNERSRYKHTWPR